MRRVAIWAGAIFALDQITKLWVLFVLDLPRLGEIEVLPPYVVFRMAWNRGVNFGLMAGDSEWLRAGLITLALVICALVLRWMRGETSRIAQVSAGILIGGAIGNVIDRIAYGAVADFLNMSCCGIDNPYVFNVADIAIVVGALGLAVFGGAAERRA